MTGPKKKFPEHSEDFLLYGKKLSEEELIGDESEKPKEEYAEKESLDAAEDVTITLSENPYSANGKQTSDIVRLFYINDTPIIPVVSKRGTLLGILKKDDVVAELSDLERSNKYKIDEFITKLAKKPPFEELLQYGAIREFPVINIFGELQGRWTRIQLLAAGDIPALEPKDDMRVHKEEQVLEWMIYLILEHIPRALYAVNEKGKTIFYNSRFEQLYTSKRKEEDVDLLFVEKTLKNADRNELVSGHDKYDIYFYNKDFELNYEKVPLLSNKKKVGYLIYFDHMPAEDGITVTGADIRGMSLENILASVERQIIVDSLRSCMNIKDAAESLGITKQSLLKKMEKLEIKPS
ncbi:MAG: hypothetical protein FWG13_07355 [Leptospirales bacterium]|nr:hypothetical protein [Leptospirales bacterium]